jgi:hypothetical protein
MNTTIHPNPAGKEKGASALHRIYAMTACSLAILIVGNLAKIPASEVDIKAVIAHFNDQLDLLVKVQTAYLKACKIQANPKKGKEDITLGKKAEIDPLSQVQHACFIPRESFVNPGTKPTSIEGLVLGILSSMPSYRG